jgi:methylated-DNA-[protein]-cysteine S-methyltransferase
MEGVFYSMMQSAVGPLQIAVSDRGLRMINFAHAQVAPGKPGWRESEAETGIYRAQLAEYFAGKRRQFDFALDLRGTDFQQRCWRELMRILYGETCSYAQLAHAVGCARGFRAVGQANHHNPVPIVVPCHRVLASDGTLGGYGGGLQMKQTLLELEGATFRINKRGGPVRAASLFA